MPTAESKPEVDGFFIGQTRPLTSLTLGGEGQGFNMTVELIAGFCHPH